MNLFRSLYPYIEKLGEISGLKETTEDIREADKLLEVIRVALSHQLIELIKNLKNNQGVSYDVKWNSLYQIDIAKVSMMHALYMSAKAFYDGLEKLTLKKQTMDALWMVCKFFFCDVIIKRGESALLSDYINGSQLINIEKYYYELMEQIRPHMVALVEAPVITENVVQATTIGDKSSDYCSKMFEAAKFSKLNTKEKLDSIDEDLKPLSKKLRNFARL